LQKKRTRIRLCTQQALAQQLQQQGGVEMDSLVSGVKFIKRTVKKKVILISIY
jgi:hypothetical protein